MIEGVTLKDLPKNIDERGFLSEILRSDWKEFLREAAIVQFNLSYSYPDVVRAWHRHLRGQVDYFICVDGAVKVCAYDDQEDSSTFKELDEIILSDERLQVVRVPGRLWHGYKALGVKPIKLLYGVNRLYSYKEPDEERRPWDDPSVIPKTINGKRADPRLGKPWDWFFQPFR